MTGAPAATLKRAGAAEALGKAPRTHGPSPLGLGSSALPFAGCSMAAPRLRRQWTAAPGRSGAGGSVACNVLPFFLDLSLALSPPLDLLDAVKSSVDSEVVFQATLQVPAHHALACRMSAYGTPFAAPDLQAAAHELGDEDLEFAACIASPPDLDEQLSVNFGRVMSLLDRQRGEAGAVTRVAHRPAASEAPGSAAANLQQQLRGGAGQQGQAQAPKVLVSVDEAETTAAQLQRANSAKKQPKLTALQGYGKRAMQALLGLGYLLTVLHEKSFGGHLEFTASALTAATSATPSMSGGHVRQRPSGSLRVPAGVLAGLRSLMADCPSLSPRTDSFGRPLGAAALASLDADAAAGAASPRNGLAPVPSFEAAWERIAHTGSAGGGAVPRAERAAAAARAGQVLPGLTLQLSVSAPLSRVFSSSLDGSAAGSAPATPARARMAATWQLLAQGPQTPASPASQQAAQSLSLSKGQDLGRSGSMDALLDAVIQQVSTGSGAAATPDAASPPGSAPATPPPPRAGGQLPQPVTPASHVLPDQGPLTSPLAGAPAAALPQQQQHAAAAELGDTSAFAFAGMQPLSSAPSPTLCSSAGGQSQPATPRVLRPLMSMRLSCQPAWLSNSELAGGGASASSEQAAAPAPAAQGGAAPAGHDDAAGPAGAPATAAAAAAAAAAARPPVSPPARKPVHMHQAPREQQHDQASPPGVGSPTGLGSGPSFGIFSAAPQGLWPTLSFSLVPVRLPPPSPRAQLQPPPAAATGRA